MARMGAEAQQVSVSGRKMPATICQALRGSSTARGVLESLRLIAVAVTPVSDGVSKKNANTIKRSAHFGHFWARRATELMCWKSEGMPA